MQSRTKRQIEVTRKERVRGGYVKITRTRRDPTPSRPRPAAVTGDFEVPTAIAPPPVPEGTTTRFTSAEGQLPGLQIRACALEAIDGPDRGRRWVLNQTVTAAGHGPRNDVVLEDCEVARVQFEIRILERGYFLRDRSGGPGTWIDTVLVRSAFLRRGAVIRVGGTVLRFTVLDKWVDAPLAERCRFGELIGVSSAMRQAFAILERVAATELNLLIEGETGTGKDLAARAVHASSERRHGPFVVLDCGAVTQSLIASRLLGHERGAFTGADRRRPGAFELANGGTLFLDEIGELDPSLQPILLRAIDRGEVVRLGGDSPIKVDVRIIAATHRALDPDVGAESFRSDLFYRITGVRVRMPPLRERPEDIPLLLDHFLRHARDEAGAQRCLRSLSPRAIEGLKRQLWPGNVRELRNLASRMVALADEVTPEPRGPELRGSQLALTHVVDTGRSFRDAKAEWAAAFDMAYLRAVLTRAGGNVSRAAREACMNRSHLTQLIKNYELTGPDGE